MKMTTEKHMQTAVTAFSNGKIMEHVGFTPADVETYRAVYIQAFDLGCSDAMKSTGSVAIEMAIEDAEMDHLALA